MNNKNTDQFIEELNELINLATTNTSIAHSGSSEEIEDSLQEYINGYTTFTNKYSDLKQEPEIVICSAVKLTNGMIFRGHRHTDCIKTAHAFVTWNGGNNPGEHHWNNKDMIESQGFITSKNRYVGRHEAFNLQVNAGIDSIAVGGYRGNQLFSEDLY
jgi:hypothetical protein